LGVCESFSVCAGACVRCVSVRSMCVCVILECLLWCPYVHVTKGLPGIRASCRGVGRCAAALTLSASKGKGMRGMRYSRARYSRSTLTIRNWKGLRT
jgi:hypothetical protein